MSISESCVPCSSRRLVIEIPWLKVGCRLLTSATFGWDYLVSLETCSHFPPGTRPQRSWTMEVCGRASWRRAETNDALCSNLGSRYVVCALEQKTQQSLWWECAFPTVSSCLGWGILMGWVIQSIVLLISSLNYCFSENELSILYLASHSPFCALHPDLPLAQENAKQSCATSYLIHTKCSHQT